MTKLILITGISKGLGYAMTEGFIRQGHTVIGCARSSDAIDKIRQKYGAPNDFTSVDVAKRGKKKQADLNWISLSCKAQELGEKIRNEDGVTNAVEAFQRHLGLIE